MKYCLPACFSNSKMYIVLVGVKILDICLSHISKWHRKKNPGAILLKLVKCSSFVKTLMIQVSSNKQLDISVNYTLSQQFL